MQSDTFLTSIEVLKTALFTVSIYKYSMEIISIKFCDVLKRFANTVGVIGKSHNLMACPHG